MSKEYSRQRIARLVKTVSEWVQNPNWSERSFGPVPRASSWIYPSRTGIAVRCRCINGTFAGRAF